MTRVPCTSADLAAAMIAAERRWTHTRLRARINRYSLTGTLDKWRARYIARAVSLRAHYGRQWSAKGERQ